ncbi:hypothetical protein J7I94_10760 [Streptomyces sp. ISL-12]|nr:hypothetical protein [Streptomyces sp. ISL-12]
MVLSGAVGWLASFRLTVDDRRLLSAPGCRPPSDISPVVSCGSVMSSPRGGLFGFPDTLIGLGAFAAVAALGVTAHCLERGVVPSPRGVRDVVRVIHGMLLAAWHALIALLVPTRFRPYWSSPPRAVT